MTTILSVDNISGAAYRLSPPPGDSTIEFATPAEISDEVMRDQVDAALVPVADLPLTDSQYQPSGHYGIACEGPVGSVKLFCTKPLSEIASENQPIYLDGQSRTSRSLFVELYRRRFSCLPNINTDERDASARLYIGNLALDSMVTKQDWAEVVDLGAWWFEETKMPFVFARWVARRSLAESEQHRIERWLHTCTREALSRAGRRTMENFHANQIPSAPIPAFYYDRLRYRLTDREIEGLEHFLTIVQKETPCAQIA